MLQIMKPRRLTSGIVLIGVNSRGSFSRQMNRKKLVKPWCYAVSLLQLLQICRLSICSHGGFRRKINKLYRLIVVDPEADSHACFPKFQ